MFAQSQGSTPEQIEEVRRNLGLDKPIYIQYFMYVEKLFQGDLGYTIRGGQPVIEVIFQRLPNTIKLACAAMLIAISIGLPIGFFAAYRKGTIWDTIVMIIAIAGISMPHFWLGLILLFFFAYVHTLVPTNEEGKSCRGIRDSSVYTLRNCMQAFPK